MIECKIEKGNLTISGEGDTLELLTEAMIIVLDTIGRCSTDEESFYRNKNIVIHMLAKLTYADLHSFKELTKDGVAENEKK